MSEISSHFIAEGRPGENQIRITLSEHENHGHTNIVFSIRSRRCVEKKMYIRKAIDATGLNSKILEKSQENINPK